MEKNENNDLGGLNDPRILFAAERTLLAWVRTGLVMMGFGFVVARFGLVSRPDCDRRFGRAGNGDDRICGVFRDLINRLRPAN